MSAQPGLVEYDDHYEFPRYGMTITRLTLDYELALSFLDSEDRLVVSLSTPFTITTGSDVIDLDPESPSTLSPALGLLRQPVDTIRAFKDGTLEVVFVDGRRLRSLAAQYEAWQIYGRNGVRIISLPGGDYALWRPLEPT